jgi:hypothetical protein
MEPTNRGLQRGLRRLVTLTSLLVGLDSFELGLDVRHDRPLELFLIWWWGAAVQAQPPTLPAASSAGQIRHIT